MQAPSGSRSTSENGQADLRAAEAEADMTEAGDVGEWLGMDSTRKVVANAAAVNGHSETDAGQQHRLSKKTSSSQLAEVTLQSLQGLLSRSASGPKSWHII